MKKITIVTTIALLTLSGCAELSEERKTNKAVEKQQSQYAIGQPIPVFDHSLERELLIQLYNLRNEKVSTHSVWRSDYGLIEGSCTSMGYGLPYDTSLTNPYKEYRRSNASSTATQVGQAEPNGVFASTNTSATWVMCLSKSGSIEPHYIESKVAVYPYPVTVDYENNRVIKKSDSKINFKVGN